VVAAGVGGLRHVVRDGVTGFLVDGHDPGDHAERMLQILRDASLQRSLGREGARSAQGFSWDVTAEEMLRVYREVAGAR
jgi:D-inositol-3-phosphate glycosyltransferase